MFEFDYVSTTRPEGQAVVNLSKGQFLRFCRYVKLIQKSQERRPPPPVQPGHSILHLQFGRALRFHKMGVARRAASKAGRRSRPMFLCVRTRVADAGCLPCTTCVCVPDRCCRARAGVVCRGLAALQPPAVDELGRTQAEVDAHNARVRALELDAKATAARESPSPLHRRSPSPPLLLPQAPNNGSMTLAGSSPPPLSEAASFAERFSLAPPVLAITHSQDAAFTALASTSVMSPANGMEPGTDGSAGTFTPPWEILADVYVCAYPTRQATATHNVCVCVAVRCVLWAQGCEPTSHVGPSAIAHHPRDAYVCQRSR